LCLPGSLYKEVETALTQAWQWRGTANVVSKGGIMVVYRVDVHDESSVSFFGSDCPPAQVISKRRTSERQATFNLLAPFGLTIHKPPRRASASSTLAENHHRHRLLHTEPRYLLRTTSTPTSTRSRLESPITQGHQAFTNSQCRNTLERYMATTSRHTSKDREEKRKEKKRTARN
jgi:hypothetical protein